MGRNPEKGLPAANFGQGSHKFPMLPSRHQSDSPCTQKIDEDSLGLAPRGPLMSLVRRSLHECESPLCSERTSVVSQEPFLSHLPRLFQTTALHVRFVLWSTCHWAMSMTMRSSNTKQRHRSSAREDDQHLVARFECSLNLLDQSNRLSVQLGIPALLPSPCSVALFHAVFCA